MDGQRARRIVITAWLGYAGLVTIKQLLDPNQRGLPPPRMFLASGVLFSMYYLAAGPLKTFPAVLAVGTDIAVLLNPYIKGSNSGVIQSLTGAIDTIAGQAPAPSSPSPAAPPPGAISGSVGVA